MRGGEKKKLELKGYWEESLKLPPLALSARELKVSPTPPQPLVCCVSTHLIVKTISNRPTSYIAVIRLVVITLSQIDVDICLQKLALQTNCSDWSFSCAPRGTLSRSGLSVCPVYFVISTTSSPVTSTVGEILWWNIIKCGYIFK